MTTDDMLFSNNSNIFVVDEETEKLSKESGCFHLKCHYRKCTLRENAVQNEWCEDIVKFVDLITDHDNQRIFFYDYGKEERALQESISRSLRTRFVDLWHQLIKFDFSNDQDLTRDWHSIQADLLKMGIYIPDNPGLHTFRTLIHAVLTQLNLAVWDKGVGGMGGFYRSQHELVFIYRKGAAQHRNNIQLGKFGRNRTNVWSYPSANMSRQGRVALKDHPTPKPVAMIADIMKDVTVIPHILTPSHSNSAFLNRRTLQFSFTAR